MTIERSEYRAGPEIGVYLRGSFNAMVITCEKRNLVGSSKRQKFIIEYFTPLSTVGGGEKKEEEAR